MYVGVIARHAEVHKEGDDRKGMGPSKTSFPIITRTLDTCLDISHTNLVFHFVEWSYKRYFETSKACWKATLVVFSCFCRLPVLRSLASCLRTLSALRSGFFDVRRSCGLPSSFMRRRGRPCLRDAVEDQHITGGSDVLVPPSSECAPPVLWLVLVTLDGELKSGGSLLGTVGVRSVREAVRSTDAVAAVATCALGEVRCSSSRATDSLCRAPIVVDCTLTAYSAAMCSATAAKYRSGTACSFRGT